MFEIDVRKLIGTQPTAWSQVGGRHNQLGAGKYTLCPRCNNDTGTWYAASFVDWARDGMRLLSGSKGHVPSLWCPYTLHPLRVIKQVLTMFFSACGPGFRKQHPDLVRLVLNKESRDVPPGIRVYAFYCDPFRSTATRQSGVTGLLVGDRLRSHLFAEIAFPPFGFLVTITSNPPDHRLHEITYFGKYDYTHRERLFLRLPVLPICSYLPGNYRTFDDISNAAG